MSKAASSALALLRRRPAPEDPTLPAILEFQWPSTAVVNAPVPRLARGVVWIISSMVLAVVALMGVIPVDRVVTARGIVVSQAATILVQPLETAIVKSIDVHEGERVKAGQGLARLDPTFAAADVAALESQVASLDAEVARLRAESEGKAFTYSGADPYLSLQAAIYGHRKAELDAKIENYSHRIGELDAVIARSQSDAAGYRERLGFAQSIEQMRKVLESQQAGSRLNTLLSMDSRAEMERSLASAQQIGEGARRDQAALSAERDAFVRGWQGDVAQKLSEQSGKAEEAHEQLNKARLRRNLVELRSDTDAIVQSVAKVSVGAVMQSGQQLITLVPMNAPLEVEANIPGNENGFVHISDPVAVKFDTFPYSQYGMAGGTVRVVSPDAFTPQSEARNPTSTAPVASSEPFYRSRISIDRVALHGVPGGFQLVPGMPVTADIKVGQRTVLGYLVGLMLPVAREAMREP